MLEPRPTAIEAIAANLKRLMERHKWSQVKLARESDVSQTHISSILRGESGASIGKIEQLASAFNLEPWHLLLPGLPNELLESPSVARLVEAYVTASARGRTMIDAMAERELELRSNTRRTA